MFALYSLNDKDVSMGTRRRTFGSAHIHLRIATYMYGVYRHLLNTCINTPVHAHLLLLADLLAVGSVIICYCYCYVVICGRGGG